jgi:uncharacterized YccA/Bax inhibitor family protein
MGWLMGAKERKQRSKMDTHTHTRTPNPHTHHTTPQENAIADNMSIGVCCVESFFSLVDLMLNSETVMADYSLSYFEQSLIGSGLMRRRSPIPVLFIALLFGLHPSFLAAVSFLLCSSAVVLRQRFCCFFFLSAF